jgi:NADPH2:quinone reductase
MLRGRDIEFKAAIARNLEKHIWPLLESGKIKPVIHSVFPAHEASKAHELMESGSLMGKVVLTWE